jgi:hypothetical protein
MWRKVWINGKQVLVDKSDRGAVPGSVRTEVELKAGWNEVVVKQGAKFFGYKFYFEFKEPDGRPISDLHFTLEKTR